MGWVQLLGWEGYSPIIVIIAHWSSESHIFQDTQISPGLTCKIILTLPLKDGFINPWLFDKIGVSVDKKASQISYSSFLGTDKTSITLKRLLDVILRKDLNRCCLSLEYVYLISKFHTLFDTLLKEWKTKTHHHLFKVFLQSTGGVECNSVLARHLDHHGHRHGGRGDDEHDQAAVRLGVADCGLVSGSFSVLLPVPPTRHQSILQKYNYKRLLLHLLPSLYNSR